MSIRRMWPALVFALSFGAAGVVAQSQQPAVSADQHQATPSETVTIAGCVQKESAVLKRNPVAGNVGMDDEFVLTHAAKGSAPGANDVPKPDVSEPPAAVGTSGMAGNFGTVYRLTGDKESELKGYVGQRVEITGSFKHEDKAADAMSAAGTSGKAGDLTPANTPEITIEAIKPVSGTCAPAIK